MPKVSIIMAVYNGKRYIGEAIESILNQTFRDFEFIIINDASTDNTEAVIRAYMEKDPMIKLINNEVNSERSFSRNRGIKIAQGEYISIIDADDICYPKKLEKQVAFLEKNKAIGFVGTSFCVIDEHSRVISFHECSGSHIKEAIHLLFAFPSILARKECLDNMEGYRSVFEPAEDYDLWLRASEKYGAGCIEEPLYQYRVHGESSTMTQRRQMDIGIMLTVAAAEERRKTGHDSFSNLSQNDVKRIRGDVLVLSDPKVRKMFSLRHLIHSRAAYVLGHYEKAASYARTSLYYSCANAQAWIIMLKIIPKLMLWHIRISWQRIFDRGIG